jgi:hypothetical protein
MQLPVTVLNASTKRESGKKAQFGNIAAAKVRQCSRECSVFSARRARFRTRARPLAATRARAPGFTSR